MIPCSLRWLEWHKDGLWYKISKTNKGQTFQNKDERMPSDHHQAAWFESCTMGRVSLKLDAVQRANRKRRIEPWKSPYCVFPKIPSPSNQAYVFNKRENSWIIWKSTTYQQLKYCFIRFNCFQRFSLSSQHHTNPLLQGAKLCNSQDEDAWSHSNQKAELIEHPPRISRVAANGGQKILDHLITLYTM